MSDKKKFNPFVKLSAMNGLSVVFVLIIIAIVIVVLYASTSISPYRERGYMHSLKEDLRNAHKAGLVSLAAHPEAIIVSEEQLKSKGWSKSDTNAFVSADMTSKKGQIVLTSEYFAKQPEYASGTGSISFDGTIVLPIKKSDTKASN
jgi:c-di-AMP phosphodiesterase-like protein